MTTDTATEVFEEHRSVLMGVAYRMLGRVADAEDVVQEAWLRWSGADRSEVREPRGYLVRVTTRLAIDRLRQVQSRNEAYVGPWLPEPYVTDFGDTVADTAERAVLADSVSLAVLVVLESLSPWSARCSCSGGLRLPVRGDRRRSGPRRAGGAPARRAGPQARRGKAPALRGRPGRTP